MPRQRNRAERRSEAGEIRRLRTDRIRLRIIIGIFMLSWCHVARFVNRLVKWLSRCIGILPQVSVGFHRFSGLPCRCVRIICVGDRGTIKRPKKVESVSRLSFLATERMTKTSWFSGGENRRKPAEKKLFRFSVHNPRLCSLLLANHCPP